MSKRRTKKRKKMESAGKQWEHRRNDPTYIDGRSKQARKLIKRLSKRKKMAEETLLEYGGGMSDNKSGGSSSGGDNTSQAYKFIAQKRKVQKKQEREKRASNRKQEIQTISRAKASDYQKKAKDRQKKLSTQLQKKEEFDALVYMESLFEQLENENENPVYYFFNDESELEVTNEQAYDIVEKFGSLSDENKELFLDKIAESNTFLSHIILL